ncbi:hypothetical protein LL037_04350 [Clostridium estertheticum]|uniref:VOC family protein n=1 Tax=Clostridium estertheticum TaxID=238834 RepID=UPI001C0AECC2|nr:VOC family protein [Clostridium estertheticum]MBU3200070.1 hypothetical protein [Clostridium estertheticum]WAG66391.1 hypothetical protein LL037_04350 [Clostridium estertheticum]
MSNKSHTNGNKGKSSMELIAMHHMHGWMDDPEKTFVLFIELSEFEGDDGLIKNMMPLYKPLVTPQGTLGIERLDHVHAWTTDADGAARFYSDVFGMTTHSWIDPKNNIKIALLKAKNNTRSDKELDHEFVD